MAFYLPHGMITSVLKNVLNKYPIYPHLRDIGVLFLMASSLVNPIFYFIALENIRKGLKDLFTRNG